MYEYAGPPFSLRWFIGVRGHSGYEFQRETLPVFWRKNGRLVGCRASWTGETRDRNARQDAEMLRRFVE